MGVREVQLRMLFSSAPYGGEEFNSLLAASLGKLLKFPLGRKLNEPWSRSGHSGEHTKVFILLGFETQPSRLGSSLHRPR